MRADLHIHTTASDGCWTPERVVAELKARSIGLFAIADHDTTANVPAVEASAREEDLAFLRGVEVSTRLDRRIFHILAYGVDPESPALMSLLGANRASTEQSNGESIRHLIAAGYPIDPDDYTAYEYDPTLRGGWKLINFLMDRGLCTGVSDYFDNLMAKIPTKVPAFVHPVEAIATIREAGGTPILAHPGVSLNHTGVTEDSLYSFLDFGVAGLECHSQYHDETTARFCLDWCTRHSLLVTGGSDYHGGFIGREVGVPVVDAADLRLGELEERIVR